MRSHEAFDLKKVGIPSGLFDGDEDTVLVDPECFFSSKLTSEELGKLKGYCDRAYGKGVFEQLAEEYNVDLVDVSDELKAAKAPVNDASASKQVTQDLIPDNAFATLIDALRNRGTKEANKEADRLTAMARRRRMEKIGFPVNSPARKQRPRNIDTSGGAAFLPEVPTTTTVPESAIYDVPATTAALASATTASSVMPTCGIAHSNSRFSSVTTASPSPFMRPREPHTAQPARMERRNGVGRGTLPAISSSSAKGTKKPVWSKTAAYRVRRLANTHHTNDDRFSGLQMTPHGPKDPKKCSLYNKDLQATYGKKQKHDRMHPDWQPVRYDSLGNKRSLRQPHSSKVSSGMGGAKLPPIQEPATAIEPRSRHRRRVSEKGATKLPGLA